MDIIPVNELMKGDTLGRGLYAPDGRLMLRQGTALNDPLIEGIKRWGYRYIFINMADHRAAVPGSEIKRNLLDMTTDVLTQIVKSLQNDNAFPQRALNEWSDLFATMLEDRKDILVASDDLAPRVDELIDHSVNVAFLSMLTARALGYRNRQLEEVAVGALLHDIGLFQPHNDSLKLNHPLIGYDLLSKQRDIPQGALTIVAQHHEQLNGQGFPKGIGGEQLTEGAQICGLASLFDTYMNDPEIKRMPAEGFDMVLSMVDKAYSGRVAVAFLSAFQPYPVGAQVGLTAGLRGVIVALNPAHPGRPVVQLANSEARIDLMKHTSFRIEKVIDTR